MSRFFFAALVVLSLALAPGLVMGQETNATATATETPTEEIAVQIDSTTTLSSWGYENGTWRLTFDAEVPTRIVITDSAKTVAAWEEAGEGRKVSVDPNPERYNLKSGETVVTYPGTTYDGQAAITVATSDGMRFLATGGIQGTREPVPWRTAAGLIVLAGVGSAYGTARWVRRRYESKDRGAERIA